MSSILDALRKLEEEKSAAAEAPDVVVDDVVAERDLIGGGSGGAALHISPLVLILAGGGIFMMTLAVVVVAVVYIERSNRLPEVAYEVPAAPVSTASMPVENGTPSTASIQPAPATVTVTEEAAPSEMVTPAAPEEPVRVAEASPAPRPAPPRVELQQSTTPKPAPVAAEPESPRVDVTGSIPLPGAVETAPAEPEETSEATDFPADVNLWPRLTSAVKSRVLGDKKLHMARPLGRPRPSAVIDMEPVYLGDVIPNSQARLVEVTGFGVGIEVLGTGERYYWRMGV